jgi:DNA-3-methyladenine glycosylase II
MSKPPSYWNKARRYLSSKDRVMKTLIEKYSDASLTTRKNIFLSLCKSIIGQLIQYF